MIPSIASCGSVVGSPAALIAQPSGIALALLPRQIDFAACDSCVGDVEHHGRVLSGRRSERPRVGPDRLLAAAPRRHGGTRVGGEERDASIARRHQRVIHRGAEVVGVAYANRTDAVRLCPFDRFPRGERGQHLADSVVAVDHRNRACIGDELRLRHRLHHAGANAREVPAQPQHAVGLVPPEVRLHQRVGDEAGILLGNASARVDSGAEVRQAIGVNAIRGSGSHGEILPVVDDCGQCSNSVNY